MTDSYDPDLKRGDPCVCAECGKNFFSRYPDDVEQTVCPHCNALQSLEEAMLRWKSLEAVPDTGTLKKELIPAIRKNVKDEHRNIDIVLNTGLSAFTSNPINLAVVGKSSEGKTYLVTESLKFFPQKYVWMYRKISPKVFTRERGTLAVRVTDGSHVRYETEIENEFSGLIVSVGSYLSFLKEEADEKKKREGDEHIDPSEAKRALESLKQGLYTLVDLRNRILVFLDRPEPALWNELLSVLSHDQEFVVTSFVEGEGIKRVKNVVFWGWPACIFCTSREEDFNWKDLETRFQIIEPAMSSQKYKDAIDHSLSTEYGLASSDDEYDRISERLQTLIEWMIRKNPRVLLPVPPKKLTHLLTGERIDSGDLMRKVPRIIRHAAMNALFHAHERVLLNDGSSDHPIMAYHDISRLAFLFDDLELGASMAGMGTASYELLTRVMMPMFEKKEDGEFVENVRQKDVFNELKDYVESKGRLEKTHLSKSKATLTRHLSSLESRGIIKKFADEEDKRGLRIVLLSDVTVDLEPLSSRIRKLVSQGGISRETNFSKYIVDMRKYVNGLEYLKNPEFTFSFKGKKLVSQEGCSRETISSNSEKLVSRLPDNKGILEKFGLTDQEEYINSLHEIQRLSGFYPILSDLRETNFSDPPETIFQKATVIIHNRLKSARGEYIEQSPAMLSSGLKAYGIDIPPDQVSLLCDRSVAEGHLAARNGKYAWAGGESA